MFTIDSMIPPGWDASPLQGYSPGGEATRSIHDRGSDAFLGVENLHAQYFFASKDLSSILLENLPIFLGFKKIKRKNYFRLLVLMQNHALEENV